MIDAVDGRRAVVCAYDIFHSFGKHSTNRTTQLPRKCFNCTRYLWYLVVVISFPRKKKRKKMNYHLFYISPVAVQQNVFIYFCSPLKTKLPRVSVVFCRSSTRKPKKRQVHYLENATPFTRIRGNEHLRPQISIVAFGLKPKHVISSYHVVFGTKNKYFLIKNNFFCIQ